MMGEGGEGAEGGVEGAVEWAKSDRPSKASKCQAHADTIYGIRHS